MMHFAILNFSCAVWIDEHYVCSPPSFVMLAMVVFCTEIHKKVDIL